MRKKGKQTYEVQVKPIFYMLVAYIKCNKSWKEIFLVAPEKSFVTSTHVTHLEGEIFSPVFCDGEANPPPDVSWSRNEEVISNENTLDFVKPVSRWIKGFYLVGIEECV